MKHPFVLLALLACFAIAVLAYTPAQASSPTVAVVSSQPEAPSQTCWGCGPVPQPGGVFDRGPRPHATGYVNGSYYCVAFGDTLFSISQRFGVSAQQIAAANGIPNPWLIWANQFILIPGLGIARPSRRHQRRRRSHSKRRSPSPTPPPTVRYPPHSRSAVWRPVLMAPPLRSRRRTTAVAYSQEPPPRSKR
ncbi:MAG: LysM peptidoglycan-binding domain-containing protein [Anaerolineales bacterium]|nr:LysM peptidoglycan-binding domain-containing protein [Anaerolineales bacterium]